MIAQPAPVAVEKPLPAMPPVVEPEPAEALPVAAATPHLPISTPPLPRASLPSPAISRPRRERPRTGSAVRVVAVATVVLDWNDTISSAGVSTSPESAVGADSLAAAATRRATATGSVSGSSDFAWFPDCSAASTASTAAAVDAVPGSAVDTRARGSAVDTRPSLATPAKSGYAAFDIPDSALVRKYSGPQAFRKYARDWRRDGWLPFVTSRRMVLTLVARGLISRGRWLGLSDTPTPTG